MMKSLNFDFHIRSHLLDYELLSLVEVILILFLNKQKFVIILLRIPNSSWSYLSLEEVDRELCHGGTLARLVGLLFGVRVRSTGRLLGVVLISISCVPFSNRTRLLLDLRLVVLAISFAFFSFSCLKKSYSFWVQPPTDRTWSQM